MKALKLNEASRPLRSASDPDPEVPAKARRRTFTAKYKLEILGKAEQCSEPGEIGALLRREGLYSSMSKKTLPATGEPPGRELLMEATTTLSERVGVQAACSALGVHTATNAP